MHTRRLLAAAVVLAAGERGAAAQPITEILVEGNTKTTTRTVVQIAQISIGDEWTGDMTDRIQHELESSGLFKEVVVAPEPGTNGVRVHIVARDKHSWVIAPTYYDQPTNRGGGVGFGENNLFGENKKLLLYGQVATGDSFFVGAYVDPSIAHTRFRWQYDAYLKSSRIFEYAAPTSFRSDPAQVRTSRIEYLNSGVQAGARLVGDLFFDQRIRAAKVSYAKVGLAEGATPADVTGDPTTTMTPAPGDKGWDVSEESIVTWDTRSNWYGITTGHKVQVRYEHALPALGSSFDYWLATASFEHAQKILDRHNLDVRARLGYGHHLPFQSEYTAGGTSLRGYANDEFRGDTKAALNVEYSVPLFTVKGVALRGLGFFDAAYLTFRDTAHADRAYLPGAEVRGLAPLRTSVGVGTRIYMRQIVLPLLGLDVGYAPEARTFQVYFAIGLTDL
jgi:outer membrane protein insertion porin family